jgi:hypothetical protein
LTGPVAYCAPGRTDEARAALERDGEQAGEIREHPWLAGFHALIILTPGASTAPDYPLC